MLVPTDVNKHGRQKKTTITEAILNWQLETLLAHNNAFKTINSKIVEVKRNSKDMIRLPKRCLWTSKNGSMPWNRDSIWDIIFLKDQKLK